MRSHVTSRVERLLAQGLHAIVGSATPILIHSLKLVDTSGVALLSLPPPWAPAIQPRLLARSAGCLLSLGALLTACGEAPPEGGDSPAVTPPTPAGMVDWNRRVVSLRSPGWSLEFCEGDAPFLCVARGNEPVGSVELMRLPVHDHAVIAGVLGRGGSDREALEAAAAEFVAVLSADRRIGLGEDYHLRADPPLEATVLGKPGLRLVVEGLIEDRVHERIVQYHAIHQDTFYLLAASASGGGGMSGDFATDDLRAFEPVFAEIAARSQVNAIAP